MKQIVHPKKQKFVIVSVAALAILVGLESASHALGLYQIKSFFRISLYVYLFLIFWQSFIFDLHLRKSRTAVQWEKSFFKALTTRFGYMLDLQHFMHYQNYLILPGVIYWSAIGILFLNPFDQIFKQVTIIAASIALATSFWYMKTVFYAHRDGSRASRQAIFLAKFLGIYLSYAAGFGLTRYLGQSPWIFSAFVFLVTAILLYQAFWQHHFITWKSVWLISLSSLGLGLLGSWIFSVWNVNYFSGALVMAAVYNTMWGIFHHKLIDKNLNRVMVYEYLAVLFVVLVIIFNTTNFSERII